MDTLEDTAADNPVEVAEDRELRRLLARAINTLPEREKTVVTLYYYEGLTLAEIGNVLGVTESRVSQIHTKSVLQLRAKLADSRPLSPGGSGHPIAAEHPLSNRCRRRVEACPGFERPPWPSTGPCSAAPSWTPHAPCCPRAVRKR